MLMFGTNTPFGRKLVAGKKRPAPLADTMLTSTMNTVGAAGAPAPAPEEVAPTPQTEGNIYQQTDELPTNIGQTEQVPAPEMPIGFGMFPEEPDNYDPGGGATTGGAMGYSGFVQNLYNFLANQGYFPSQGEFAENLPQAADVFEPVLPAAQEAATEAVQAGGYQPGQNEFLDWLMAALSGQPEMGTVAAAPDVTGAPTDYGYDATINPEFDQVATGTAPSQYEDIPLRDILSQLEEIGGPTVATGGNAAGTAVGAAESGTPGFEEVMKMVMEQFGSGGDSVGRENVAPSGFETSGTFQTPQELSDQALSEALLANKELAGTTVDTSGLDTAINAAFDDMLKQAREQAAEEAGARGFGTRGTLFAEKLAQKFGQAATASGLEKAKALLEAQQMMNESRTAGAQGLTAVGGQASTAAGARAGELQRETEFGGETALTQRSQDIEQWVAELEKGGNAAELIPKILQAVGGLEQGQYGLETERLGTAGGLDIEQQKVAQDAAIRAYEAQTGKQAAIGGVLTDEAQTWIDEYQVTHETGQAERALDQADVQNAISAFGQATERGLGVEAAEQAAKELGLDYKALGAENQDRLNRVLADIWEAGGQVTTEQNRIIADIYKTQVGAAGAGAELTQAGQIEAGAQNIDLIKALTDMFGGAAGATSEDAEKLMQGFAADPAMFVDFMQMLLSYHATMEQ